MKTDPDEKTAWEQAQEGQYEPVFPPGPVCCDKYIGKCPNCGRVRLEVFVDVEMEICVGVKCEKCLAQWLFDPTKAQFFHEHDDRDPLSTRPPDNNPYEGIGE